MTTFALCRLTIMPVGFTVPENKFEVFLMPFGIRDNDKFKEQKTKILADKKLPAYLFHFAFPRLLISSDVPVI